MILRSIWGCVPQVIGVGGGGSNVVNRMLEDDIVGIEAWVVNTDAQVQISDALGITYVAKGTLYLSRFSSTSGLCRHWQTRVLPRNSVFRLVPNQLEDWVLEVTRKLDW